MSNHSGSRSSSPKRRGKNSDNGKRRTHSGGRSSSKNNNSNGHRNNSSASKNPSDFQLGNLFESMIKGAAATTAAKFTSGLGFSTNEDKTPSGTIGEFDLYLFAQTWAPRFCCTNTDKCKAQDKDGVDDLTVHGLWPAYDGERNGRTYPAFCDLGKNRKFSTTDKLASHEFLKHGTCTNMSFEAYMDEGVKLEDDDGMASMRDFLNGKAGEIVNVTDIFQEAGGNKRVAIQATPHCQLQELTTCWAKLADGTAGERIDCPPHVLGSGRNSAILNRCTKVSLEASNDDMSCSFISKELLKMMKSQN